MDVGFEDFLDWLRQSNVESRQVAQAELALRLGGQAVETAFRLRRRLFAIQRYDLRMAEGGESF